MTTDFPFHDRHGIPLPAASNDTDARAEVSPGLNTVSIPPQVADALGSATGCLQFPLLFAGERMRTAAASAYRIQKRALCRTVDGIASDALDTQTGARRLAAYDDVLTELQDAYGTVVRAGMDALSAWLVEDKKYVDWYVTTYAENATLADADAVRDGIETLARGTGQPAHVRELADRYRRVVDAHGLGAFTACVDVALDPALARDPAADTGDNVDPGPPRRILRTRDLIGRARTTLDALEADDRPGIDDGSDDELRTALRDALGDEHDAGLTNTLATADWTDQPELEDLPLVVKPHRARPTDKVVRDGQNRIGYPTGRAWLYAKAFERGGYGAVLYQRSSGDPNWLVNPYVATDPVDQGRTYAAVWERAFVRDRIATQLFEHASPHHEPTGRIRCPLCALSIDSCADDDCAFAETVTAIDRRTDAIADALESVQD